MALSTPRIIGRDLTVTATAGTLVAITKWQDISLDFQYQTENATASDSTLSEKVFTVKEMTGRVSGYLGSVNNGATLPAIGDTITNLAIAVGADNTHPSLTAYTNMKVTGVSYNYTLGPSTFSFEFTCGMLNS